MPTDRPKVFFVEPYHPVCEKCISPLYREERCPECDGDGFVLNDECFDLEDDDDFQTCPECFGEPSGYFCPTCKAFWAFSELEQMEGAKRCSQNAEQ
jgi:DnaJ-class molecular chaperone